MIGTLLSHEHLTAKLGEGGMGEVYRATDTKLGREVAIKVLPASVSGDPQSVARFEREAKALAAINPPHIAAIHGFESDQGTHFIVLELVEDMSPEQARGQEVDRRTDVWAFGCCLFEEETMGPNIDIRPLEEHSQEQLRTRIVTHSRCWKR